MSLTTISLAASLFALTNPIGNMVIFVAMMQIDKSKARYDVSLAQLTSLNLVIK